MSLKPNNPEPKSYNLAWDAQSEPYTEDLQVGVIRYTIERASLAAGRLIQEADRYPDNAQSLTLNRLLPPVNEAVRSALMLIGLELMALSPLSIATETVDSPDDEFHLLVSQETPGNFVITLQVPALPDAVCSEFRVSGGYIQTRCDGGDWENLIAIEDLRGEQGEQGIQGEQGETGAQGIQGETWATGAPGADGTDGEDCTGCGTQPGEVPADEDELAPGECRSFDLVLDAASQLVLPIVLRPGYTIEVTGVSGYASDGSLNLVDIIDLSPYYCPDGSQHLIQGGCDPDGTLVHTDPEDPSPFNLHMMLLLAFGGLIYPIGFGTTVTVPEEADGVLGLFQLNDSVLYDNSGAITLHVEVCKPSSGDWCYRWDDLPSLLEEAMFDVWSVDPDIDNDYVTSTSEFASLTHIEFGFIYDGTDSGASGAGIWLEQDGSSGTQVAGGVPLSSHPSPIIYDVGEGSPFSTPDGLLFGGNVVDGTGTFGMTYIIFCGTGEMPAFEHGEVI